MWLAVTSPHIFLLLFTSAAEVREGLMLVLSVSFLFLCLSVEVITGYIYMQCNRKSLSLPSLSYYHCRFFVLNFGVLI